MPNWAPKPAGSGASFALLAGGMLASFAPLTVIRRHIRRSAGRPSKADRGLRAPHVARCLDHELQPHGSPRIDGQRVAFHGRREAALGAEADLIERCARLDRPALQIVFLERLFDVTAPARPSSFGTNRSGSKVPDRSSSYSRKKPSTAS